MAFTLRRWTRLKFEVMIIGPGNHLEEADAIYGSDRGMNRDDGLRSVSYLTK